VRSQRLTKEPHQPNWTRHKLALKTSYTKELSYTRNVNTRGSDGYTAVARDDQSITTEILGDNDDIRFFTEIHLHANKLVLVVAIHSLGGSRANRHHTSNPQSSFAQPTQDEDPQATSNPLEYLLALHRGKVKNPSQSPRSEPETSTFLCSMILTAPSNLGVGELQE
jgi:hypothetical protein